MNVSRAENDEAGMDAFAVTASGSPLTADDIFGPKSVLDDPLLQNVDLSNVECRVSSSSMVVAQAARDACEPVLAFPLHTLPSRLTKIVEDASQSFACPPDFVAVPML